MASASTTFRRSACALALIAGLHAHAAPPAPAEAARPNVGALLTEAQALVAAGQGEQALQRLQAADSLGPLNAYEAFMGQRLRAAAALQLGNLAAAQAALQAVLATNRLDPAEALQTMSALGQTLYRAKDYAAAASWLQRYAEAGGSEADVLALRAPARYFARDYAGARELLLATTKADAEALRATPLATWRMLAGTQRQLGDKDGYRQALRGMAVQHPQPALWAELVQRELGEPAAWPERQLLDVQRLLRAAGALSDTDAVLALVEQAQQAGFPGEALKVLDEALATPSLTAGQSMALAKRRDAALRQAESDRRQRTRDEAAARSARDGQALFTLGWAWVTEGQAETGLPLMEQALQRGGFKRPEEARLHHGMALALAGQKAEAQQELKQVQGDASLVALASLWADFAARRTGSAN